MHKKHQTRDISIARKTISISLSSLQQHATTEEKERERESTVVVALSWSLFAPHIIVCFLCACSFWSIFVC